MVGVFDVAACILDRMGPMTHMKLQKLVYYAQAWSLVWDERPLFKERIEAWVNGPVVRELYDYLQRLFVVARRGLRRGSPKRLNTDQSDTVDAVLEFYGPKSSQWLSDLTHMEAPWRDARKGLALGERAAEEITHASLAEYYGSLERNGA